MHCQYSTNMTSTAAEQHDEKGKQREDILTGRESHQRNFSPLAVFDSHNNRYLRNLLMRA